MSPFHMCFVWFVTFWPILLSGGTWIEKYSGNYISNCNITLAWGKTHYVCFFTFTYRLVRHVFQEVLREWEVFTSHSAQLCSKFPVRPPFSSLPPHLTATGPPLTTISIQHSFLAPCLLFAAPSFPQFPISPSFDYRLFLFILISSWLSIHSTKRPLHPSESTLLKGKGLHVTIFPPLHVTSLWIKCEFNS